MKKILMRFYKFVYQLVPFKQTIYTGLRKFSIPYSIYKHLHFNGIINVAVEQCTYFKIINCGNEDETELFWVGLENSWDKESIKLWLKLCKKKPKQIIFDLGANSGIFSLIAQSVSPNSEIFAFEPVKVIYERLKNNILMNNYKVTCENLAVSDTDGNTTIYVPPNAYQSYSASLDANFPWLPKNAILTEIGATRLSSYIESNIISQIDLLKIDVEGYEPQVLRGLGDYLANFMPDILIEVLSNEIGKELESILDGFGYLYFDIDETAGPQLVPNIIKSVNYNYFICKPQTAKYLGLL